jgi:hypothetical protein
VVADIDDRGNQDTAETIKSLGGHTLAVGCDVTRSEDVQAAPNTTVQHVRAPAQGLMPARYPGQPWVWGAAVRIRCRRPAPRRRAGEQLVEALADLVVDGDVEGWQ